VGTPTETVRGDRLAGEHAPTPLELEVWKRDSKASFYQHGQSDLHLTVHFIASQKKECMEAKAC